MDFKKVRLIISREFLTRVRKKSFIIITLLTPVFLGAMMVVPGLMATVKDSGKKELLIIDRTQRLAAVLENSETLSFRFDPLLQPDEIKKDFDSQGLYAVVLVDSVRKGQRPQIMMYSTKQIAADVQQYVCNAVDKAIQGERLRSYEIENLEEILADLNTGSQVRTLLWGADGEEKESEVGIFMIISAACGFIIYMFIFMFGGMVMRGVIEEKTTRIIEVIISSVKPVELMMGKIIGIACVALLQFAIWIGLAGVIAFVIQGLTGAAPAMPAGAGGAVAQNMALDQAASGTGSIMEMLSSVPFGMVGIALVCYFLLGYLLYASMFAAIGSACDNDTDTQQLMMPVTLPLILGMFLMMHTFQHPDSALSFWGSMIPFTSPMIMMARVPFGVPVWQLALSIGILIATFVCITIFAAKIYRVGVLMYGKKVSWRELIKWIRYKN
jgi:hypothetical protein